MAENKQLAALRDSALLLRKQLLRTSLTGHVHLGGDLSSADLMTALYQHTLHIDPKNPGWPERDRVVLSKGHGSAALYLAMANAGYFDPESVIETYGRDKTKFGTHPCRRDCLELDVSSGSLGHGLPMSVGMALAAKLDGDTHRVFCILGDGELGEGSNWEAMMAAHQYGLGNLVAIVDRNMLSLDGPTECIMGIDPLDEKWAAFGWNVVCVNGNDMQALVETLDALPPVSSRVPTVLIAKTVKGKGVSFMENVPRYHSGSVTQQEYEQACRELDAAREAQREEKV